ncbi:MAG TPA: CocE/NonD family hydrolase, partial [Gemmataceae bacterium]|nr:CocE/NonD family hydrolase [Gemmataceae bacterium]
NPGIENHLVMGPWYHGGWNRSDGDKLGPLAFGKGNSEFFQRDIELQFFNEHLKGTAGPKLAKAIVFETGDNRWRTFDRWPPAGGTPAKLYFGDRFRLVHEQPTEPSNDAFPSDPRKPVPFFEAPTNTMSREYMTSDQRFVWHRPDVLSYVTEPLPTAVTVAGPLQTHLTVSTTGTDADWIVKLIDVYPDPIPSGHGETDMAGKQILIRSEVVRGRYRTGYDRAVPFIPNEPTVVTVPMQDVLHMFRPGHRLMVQISSTWFPLIDRNPQKFVPNIFLARESDFEPATHRVFRGPGRESWLELEMLPAQPAGPARESR